MQNSLHGRLKSALEDRDTCFVVLDEVPERFRLSQVDIDDMSSDVRASLGRYWSLQNQSGAIEGYRRHI